MFRVVLSFCLLGFVFGQALSAGKCPEVKVKEPFDITKYVGRWYEMKRLFTVFEMFSNCVTAEYSPMEGGVIVNNTGYDVINDYYYSAIGDATIQVKPTIGKLGVLFPGSPGRGDYWVLDTDYTTYTLIWSCSESSVLGFVYNTQLTWILTRSPYGIPASKVQELEDLMDSYKINKPVRQTKQTSCLGREGITL